MSKSFFRALDKAHANQLDETYERGYREGLKEGLICGAKLMEWFRAHAKKEEKGGEDE